MKILNDYQSTLNEGFGKHEKISAWVEDLARGYKEPDFAKHPEKFTVEVNTNGRYGMINGEDLADDMSSDEVYVMFDDGDGDDNFYLNQIEVLNLIKNY